MFLMFYLDVTTLTARKKLCFVTVNQFPFQKTIMNLNKRINVTNTSKNGLRYTESHFDFDLQGL